jgi:hypothetical protein
MNAPPHRASDTPCEDTPQIQACDTVQLPECSDLLLSVSLFARWVEGGHA